MTRVNDCVARYEEPARTWALAELHAQPIPEWALHDALAYFEWHNNLTPENMDRAYVFARKHDLWEQESDAMEKRLELVRANVATDKAKEEARHAARMAELQGKAYTPGQLAEIVDLTERREKRRGRSIADVLTTWQAEGPLVHEPTGINRFDELTGGGPVYGTRIYLNGQPDAGKTLLLLQVAHEYARRGIMVGLLAVDEEDGDLTTRFAQRVGHTRKACEIRDSAILNQIRSELANLPIRFYDASWTIEEAAAHLAKLARQKGKRVFLGIDSLQTVHCDGDRTGLRELSEMSAVTARVQAVRKVATEHKLIAMVTSEMSRSAYRKADPNDLTSTMAASKHSGAVEYSARVLLGLRSVKGESDLIEVDVAKNKLGPAGEIFHLRIDRATQTLIEVDYNAPPKPDASDRRLGKVADNAGKVAALIGAHPGITQRQLQAQANATHGLGKDAVTNALAHLGDAVLTADGPRGSKQMRLCDRAD